jgi:oligopeptide/dipeptide ABC transporter ATP-binding protein
MTSIPGSTGAHADGGQPLLVATNLVKHFPVRRQLLRRGRAFVRAVDGVSFAIERGKTLGLVGESGCGKTTTSKLILGIEPPTHGTIRFDGLDVLALDREGLRRYRRSVQAVFQDPYASLDPRMRVGAVVAEPLVVNERSSASERRRRVRELLALVGLPERAADLYPHEFSGGQRQRIAIARALALSPTLVVLDEPVSALDVSIRAQILNLLRSLQQRLGVSYLFIAHDLAAVAHMSHTIAVMYLGRIVETGPAAHVALRPRHPYTQALFSAALPLDAGDEQREIVLAGEIPSPLRPPPGCRFHPRCPEVMDHCRRDEPPLVSDGDRLVACHLYPRPSGVAEPVATRAHAR